MEPDSLSSLPYPAQAPLFDSLGPDDLMRVKRVSWALRCEVERYEKAAFGINVLYGPFFESNGDIERFRIVQGKYGALVSGSALVRVLSRERFDPSDLDVFVNKDGILEVGKLLVTLGYSFLPLATVQEGSRKTSVEQSSDFVLAVEAEFSTKAPNTGTVAERYDESAVAGVFNFLNKRGKQIQLVATRGEPIEAILGFYSTLVMNVATATQVVCMYPITSFVRRWALYLRPYTWSVIRARIKYEIRGWKSMDLVTADEAADVENELSVKTRWFGDKHCWVINLPPLQTPLQFDAYRSLRVTSWSLRYSAVAGARIVMNSMHLPSLSDTYVVTWEAERAVWHHPCFRSLDPCYTEDVVRIVVPDEGAASSQDVDDHEEDEDTDESSDGSCDTETSESSCSESVRAGFTKWKYTSGVGGCLHGDLAGTTTYDQAVEDFLSGLYPLIYEVEKVDPVLSVMKQAFQGIPKKHPVSERDVVLPVAHIVTIVQDCMHAVACVCSCDEIKLTLDFTAKPGDEAVWTTCRIMVPAASLAEVKEEVEGNSSDIKRVLSFLLNCIGEGAQSGGVGFAAVRDLHAYYQRQLLARDEAIRNLSDILAKIDASTARRPRLSGSRLYLENVFASLAPECHAFPYSFGDEDWESALDAGTQLTLSLLTVVSGMRILNSEAFPGRNTGTVEYKCVCSVVCGLDGDGILSGPVFRFSLSFVFRNVPCSLPSEMSSLERMVDYVPLDVGVLDRNLVSGMGSYAVTTRISITLLPPFIQKLGQVFREASGLAGRLASDRPVV
ncbi:hypothetical protein VNI00_018032 [Paramarasmius palmivorus]|uniref:F-box domain-containing protein n=1 Tax=Paramarasmius palmivorus TaxID=297713 RepID=A0AAW0B4B2_9AGAR